MHRGSFLLLLFFAVAAFSFPLCDGDIWWHLSAGREMVARGAWLRTDPFCLSSRGTPWTDLHWGFQILVLPVFGLLGPWGLVGLRIGLVVAAIALATGRRLSWDTALIATALVFASRPFLELRPLLLTLVGLALLLRILDRPWARWTVPAIMGIQVVLVNVQGLFLLGPLFVGCLSCGAWWEGRRSDSIRLAGLGAGMVAASILNPWGISSFDLAGRVATRILPSASNLFSTEIPENQPLLGWLRDDPLRAVPWAWGLGGILLLRRKGDGSAGRWILLGATVLLSCLAVRNLPLLALAGLHAVQPRTWVWPRAVPAAAMALAAILGASALLERRWDLPGSAISPVAWPSRGILQEVARSEGPVFHELRAGGWLSWNLPERGACWADTRLVLHDAAFVREYLDVLDHPERFDGWSRSRGFSAALLPVGSWPRHRPLVAHLWTDSGWRLASCDGAWALFERRFPSDAARSAGPEEVRAAAHREFGGNPRLEEHLLRGWDGIVAHGGRP